MQALFILLQISNKFWGKFLGTKTLRSDSSAVEPSVINFHHFPQTCIYYLYINLTQTCVVILKHLGRVNKHCAALM